MTPPGWSTWNPDRPAELQEPAAGFSLTPVLYSARASAVTTLPPGPALVFGERALDGSGVAFETSFHGTRLAWRYDLSTSNGVTIDWTLLASGEWGLRFWVTLCVGGPQGARFDYDRVQGLLRGFDAAGAGRLELRAAKDPLLVTFHDDLDALAAEFAEKGYFYLGSRGTRGGFAALRFNLEEAPDMRLRATAGPATRPGLPGRAAVAALPPTRVPAQRSLQAIHDVVAWNHVYDRINKRPYTLATRFWNRQKFGGFGLWMTDTLYHALLWSLFDPAKARHNVEALFVWQCEAGNFPCLVTGNDRWLDRSQIPIASYIVWMLHAVSGERDLIDWAFPRLLRNHDWWWEKRALADTGLVAYGTSLDAGDGLYKGTKLAAKDESSMDNMAVHDPAPFDAEKGLLLSADVGLNAMLALDGEVLALIAGELGLKEEQKRLGARSEAHRQRIATWLWDAERGVFANRLLSGEFVDALAPTSFFPMAAGAASGEQCDSLIANYLRAPDKFGGVFGLPSATRDHPAYKDNVYWRGRIWGPLNYWVYQGLRRCGRDAEAAGLADMSRRLFEIGWRDRMCGENYNAESGAITDQADSDTFYAWGALLPALGLAELIDASPWQGTALAPSLAAGTVGPLRTPLGKVTLESGGEDWRIARDGASLMSGSLPGRMTQAALTAEGFAATLPACASGHWLAFDGRQITTATLDGAALEISGARLALPACRAGARLAVRFEGEHAS